MRAILAVSDLTPGSDGAVSIAARLAGRTASALHVVHPMAIVGMPLREAVRTDVGRRIQEAKAALEEQLRRAVSPGCAPASCALDFHGLHDSVLPRVRELGADLVVFAAADPRTAAGARHLAVFQRVAETAELPCLLVREPLGHPPGRVLLPLSAAEIGQGVLADACDWLASSAGPSPAAPRTELQVLHVASGAREWRELAAELDREVRWAGEQRQWSARLRIRRTVRWSPAAHMEILRAAAERVPDLVVLGPGCGAANHAGCLEDARALLLRRLPCSVLVLPGTLRSGEEGDGPRAPLPEVEASGRDAPEPDEALETAVAE